MAAAKTILVLPGSTSTACSRKRLPPDFFGAEDALYLERIGHSAAFSLRCEARWLLHQGLKHLNLSAPHITLKHTKEGRPYLSLPYAAVSFSYADHAACLLALAQCGQSQAVHVPGIGLDWEKVRMHHLPFIPQGLDAGMTAPAKLDQKNCMAAAQEKLVQWCRLEAVCKAAGSGLTREALLEMDAGIVLSDAAHDGTHDAGTAFLSGRPYTWKTVPLPGRTHVCVIAAEGIDSLGSVEIVEV